MNLADRYNIDYLIEQEFLQEFSVDGSTKCLGKPILRVETKFYYWAKPWNDGGIFQKVALKLVKIWKYLRKF